MPLSPRSRRSSSHLLFARIPTWPLERDRNLITLCQASMTSIIRSVEMCSGIACQGRFEAIIQSSRGQVSFAWPNWGGAFPIA
eukprot:6180662-Pleurochrysis_carterae.AAC.1